MKTFITRFFTGLILLTVLLSTIFGPREVLLVFVLFTSSVGLYELFSALKHLDWNPDLPLSLGCNLLLQLCAYFYWMHWYVFVLVIYLAILLCEVTFDEKIHHMRVFSSLFAFFYVAVMFSFLLLFPKHHQPYLLLVFLSAWACDTFAYCGGMLFGKHLLCPSVSPKKTVEGAISGMIGAQLFTIGFRYFFFSEIPWWVAALIVLVGSIVAQYGDFVASHFKRIAQVKDYGSLIAGHGGVLDRFDSVLFAAPAVWALLQVYLMFLA